MFLSFFNIIHLLWIVNYAVSETNNTPLLFSLFKFNFHYCWCSCHFNLRVSITLENISGQNRRINIYVFSTEIYFCFGLRMKVFLFFSFGQFVERDYFWYTKLWHIHIARVSKWFLLLIFFFFFTFCFPKFRIHLLSIQNEEEKNRYVLWKIEAKTRRQQQQ